MKRMNLFLCIIIPLLLVTGAAAATVNCSEILPWAVSTSYNVGNIVVFNGSEYSALQQETSQTGWEPPNVPALWSLLGSCATSIPAFQCAAAWASGTTYTTGAEVSYEGVNYTAIVGHTSESNWEPSSTPSLWKSLGACQYPPNPPVFSFYADMNWYLFAWNPPVPTSNPIDHYNYAYVVPGSALTFLSTKTQYLLDFTGIQYGGGAWQIEVEAVDTAGLVSVPAISKTIYGNEGVDCGIGQPYYPPPVDFTVTNVTSSSITLNWAAPNLTGPNGESLGCIGAYSIIENGNTLTYTGWPTQYTVTQLAPNTTYQFSVGALYNWSFSNGVAGPISVTTLAQ